MSSRQDHSAVTPIILDQADHGSESISSTRFEKEKFGLGCRVE